MAPITRKTVKPDSIIFTDELRSYATLDVSELRLGAIPQRGLRIYLV